MIQKQTNKKGFDHLGSHFGAVQSDGDEGFSGNFSFFDLASQLTNTLAHADIFALVIATFGLMRVRRCPKFWLFEPATAFGRIRAVSFTKTPKACR